MAKSNTSRSIPLAEITLRKYEKPYEMPMRDLVKKICLSVGLLQPGDSRDVIVDVFGVLLKEGEVAAENVKGKVVEFRQKHKLGMRGIAESNIILTFTSVIDIHHLGYLTFRTYFRFKNVNNLNEKEIITKP